MARFPEQKLPILRALRGEAVEEAEEIVLRKDGNQSNTWIAMSAEILKMKTGMLRALSLSSGTLHTVNRSNSPGKNTSGERRQFTGYHVPWRKLDMT